MNTKLLIAVFITLSYTIILTQATLTLYAKGSPYYITNCSSTGCVDPLLTCDPVCHVNNNSNVVCPTGYYITGSTDPVTSKINYYCYPCDRGYLEQYQYPPFNASYTGPSPTNFNPNCPWKCDDGFTQTSSKCTPRTDCNNASNVNYYATLQACSPSSTGCSAGSFKQEYGPSVAVISLNKNFLKVYSLSAGIVTDIIGSEMHGSIPQQDYLNAIPSIKSSPVLSYNISIAQKSGDNPVQLVLDRLYNVIYLVNAASGEIKFLAGQYNYYYSSNLSIADGVGSNARMSGMGLSAISNDNKMALFIDDDARAFRSINTTSGEVITLQVKISNTLNTLSIVTNCGGITGMSISPDKTFALINIATSVYYLNMSTRVMTQFVGTLNYYGSVDGIGTSAQIFYPEGVAISNDGSFALIGECANDYNYGGTVLNGYPIIRKITISTAQTQYVAGWWSRRGLRDQSDKYVWMYCPRYITIAPDNSYAIFYDVGDFPTYSPGDFSGSLRKVNLANNEVTTLRRFSSEEKLFSMTNIFTHKAPQICEACPVGKYLSNYTGQTECLTCPLGTHNEYTGQTTCITCDWCTQYAGVLTCRASDAFGCQCTIGYGVNTYNNNCEQCLAGTYKGTISDEPCSICPSNTYSLVGSSACTQCQPNTHSFQGSGSCTGDCPAGYELSASLTSCVLCAGGKYKNATGSNNCESCAVGTYMPTSNSVPDCESSWTGGACTGIPSSVASCIFSPSGEQCGSCTIQCKNGYVSRKNYSSHEYANIIIAPTYATQLTIRLSNVSINTNIDHLYILECPSLSSALDGLTCKIKFSSVKDADNTVYQISTGFAVISWDSLSIDMHPGWSLDYTSVIAFPDPTVCSKCPVGTYGNVTGLSSCTKCVPGTFANATGSSACTSCPAGTYTDVQGSPTCQICQACPINGYFKSGCGGAAAGVCNTCINTLNLQ
jgi:hypothetical protein